MQTNLAESAMPHILIADDTTANLHVLADMLKQHGYKPRPVSSGALALKAARQSPPDLILLDVKMPDMDGYETCRQIKADSNLAEIPVLFISGLNQPMDKVKAFQAGGVDYITKPFQFEEVEARVGTHLKLRQVRRELERRNAHLDDLVSQKTQQLTDAYKRLSILDKAKDDFLGLISHELRTPLNGLFGAAELLFADVPKDSGNVEMIDVFRESQRRLLSIIEHALLLTKIQVDSQRFCVGSVSLRSVVGDATAMADEFARRRGVKIAITPGDYGRVVGEMDLLQKAIQALVETAVKFSVAEETVRISVQLSDVDTALWIETRGRTIPDRVLEKFFEVLSIGEPITPGGDLGLAPALAERIIVLFGGRVTAENRQTAGICLKIHLLPCSPALSAANGENNPDETSSYSAGTTA
jgi:DNA-binding response OmpR family regulator/5-carboxymethyl-2-hydroxymuconate isomerase